MIATFAVCVGLFCPFTPPTPTPAWAVPFISPQPVVDPPVERKRKPKPKPRYTFADWKRDHAGLRALNVARRYLGTPYVWGGARPGGFDCSGLVQYAYGRVGKSLPRTTWTQRYWGRAVSLSHLRPGDLIFAHGASHVGIYAGGGRVLNAPHTGAVVSYIPLAYFGAEFARGLR